MGVVVDVFEAAQCGRHVLWLSHGRHFLSSLAARGAGMQGGDAAGGEAK